MIYKSNSFVYSADEVLKIEIVRDINKFRKSSELADVVIGSLNLGKVGTITHTVTNNQISVFFNVGDRSGYALGGELVRYISATFNDSIIDEFAFVLCGDLNDNLLSDIAIGWGLENYRYDSFRNKSVTAFYAPTLSIPTEDSLSKVTAYVNGLCLIKDLINEPPNSLTPDRLMDYAVSLASECNANVRTYSSDEVKNEFPLVFGVGQGSINQPRLADITWGNEKHPLITLVGKGVTFDSGGLDIKPVVSMQLMKKDMGGAAHVLGLGYIIMALKLPVKLRILVPSAENSVGSRAMRPSDVLDSRSGQTVEIGNTDAEGRLLLADGITLATETEKPDLLVDIGTLTGGHSMGVEISAMMSNNDEIAQQLQKIGFDIDDKLWQLPLWDGYLKELSSDVADISNNGTGRAGAIHVGLFLQEFLSQKVDWVHLDIFGWQAAALPARPKGGADYGIRALLQLIQERYC